MDLIVELENYSIISLRKIAKYYGINFNKDTGKSELITKISKKLVVEERMYSGGGMPIEEQKYSLRVERIRQSMIE
jgi:hypothetical protein